MNRIISETYFNVTQRIRLVLDLVKNIGYLFIKRNLHYMW